MSMTYRVLICIGILLTDLLVFFSSPYGFFSYLHSFGKSILVQRIPATNQPGRPNKQMS
jgi:hypothetical protein